MQGETPFATPIIRNMSAIVWSQTNFLLPACYGLACCNLRRSFSSVGRRGQGSTSGTISSRLQAAITCLGGVASLSVQYGGPASPYPASSTPD